MNRHARHVREVRAPHHHLLVTTRNIDDALHLGLRAFRPGDTAMGVPYIEDVSALDPTEACLLGVMYVLLALDDMDAATIWVGDLIAARALQGRRMPLTDVGRSTLADVVHERRRLLLGVDFRLGRPRAAARHMFAFV